MPGCLASWPESKRIPGVPGIQVAHAGLFYALLIADRRPTPSPARPNAGVAVIVAVAVEEGRADEGKSVPEKSVSVPADKPVATEPKGTTSRDTSEAARMAETTRMAEGGMAKAAAASEPS